MLEAEAATIHQLNTEKVSSSWPLNFYNENYEFGDLPLTETSSARMPSVTIMPEKKQDTVGRRGLTGQDICTGAPIIMRGRI